MNRTVRYPCTWENFLVSRHEALHALVACALNLKVTHCGMVGHGRTQIELPFALTKARSTYTSAPEWTGWAIEKVIAVALAPLADRQEESPQDRLILTRVMVTIPAAARALWPTWEASARDFLEEFWDNATNRRAVDQLSMAIREHGWLIGEPLQHILADVTHTIHTTPRPRPNPRPRWTPLSWCGVHTRDVQRPTPGPTARRMER